MRFSSLPELVAKVKLFVALVPIGRAVANVGHVEQAFRGTSYDDEEVWR